MSSTGPNAALARMLETGDLSDLAFACQGENFRVHKSVVCSQSPMLMAAIKDGFQESATGIMSMDNYEPKIVKRFVQYMYTGDYDDPAGLTEGVLDKANLVVGATEDESKATGGNGQQEFDNASLSVLKTAIIDHVHTNGTGDYYGVSGLTELANQKIANFFHNDSRGALLIPTLPNIIEQAVATTGNCEILDVFAHVAAKNHVEFFQSDQLEHSSMMSEFSLQLLKNLNTDLMATREVNDHLFNECDRLRNLLEAEQKKVGRERRDFESQRQKVSENREQEVEQKHERFGQVADIFNVLWCTKECRNPRCEVEFKCYIEPGTLSDIEFSQKSFHLRYSRCHYRHS